MITKIAYDFTDGVIDTAIGAGALGTSYLANKYYSNFARNNYAKRLRGEYSHIRNMYSRGLPGPNGVPTQTYVPKTNIRITSPGLKRMYRIGGVAAKAAPLLLGGLAIAGRSNS